MNTEMTIPEYISEFHKFLKESNAYDEFIKVAGYKNIKTQDPVDYIYNSINWSETSDSEYWSELNQNWKIRLKKLSEQTTEQPVSEPKFKLGDEVTAEYSDEKTFYRYDCKVVGIEEFRSTEKQLIYGYMTKPMFGSFAYIAEEHLTLRIPEAGKTMGEDTGLIDDIIKWLTEFKNGKKLQYRKCEDYTWKDIQSLDGLLSVLIGDVNKIRIKPKTVRAYTLDELLRIPFQEELQDKKSGEHYFFIRVFTEDDELLILVEDRGSGLVFRYNIETATKNLIYEDERPFGVEE